MIGQFGFNSLHWQLIDLDNALEGIFWERQKIIQDKIQNQSELAYMRRLA